MAKEEALPEIQAQDITTALSAYTIATLDRLGRAKASLELVQKEELHELKVR